MFSIYLCCAFVLIILWEHIARTTNCIIKPSTCITLLGNDIYNLFRFIGGKFAVISSFLEYLKLRELGISIYDVIKAICDLLVAPYRGFFSGYINYIQNLSYAKLVIFGSTILLSLPYPLLYYFFPDKITTVNLHLYDYFCLFNAQASSKILFFCVFGITFGLMYCFG